MESYDFCGWATKNNIKCSDGRTIMRDAFKDNDGEIVPLVWNHQHTSADNVLGHALLVNKPEGTYTYGKFNDTPTGKNAKMLVDNRDITKLSIYANQLKQSGGNVIHGSIKEVSLVLAGANPGAFIDTVIAHSDDETEEAIIYSGEEFELYHAEEKKEEKPKMAEETGKTGKTVRDVLDTLTPEQEKVVYAMIAAALDSGEKNEEGEKEMSHNLFENHGPVETDEDVLTHADMELIIGDAKRYGSLKESSLQHGITNISYLFPEDKVVGTTPEWVKREDDWVDVLMNAVHHTPFSRIKSRYADITADDARAKGYIKGNMKTEEFFSVAKRSTGPTTIYKKQKLDRDDVIDITDFDVVAWIKGEMRMMLDEEIARAVLIGDGRSEASDDKINEQCIRPIWTDNDIFTVKKVVEFTNADSDDAKAKKLIRAIIKSRKDYKGSGNPILFTTEDWLTDMLLIEDTTGRVIYDTEEKLRTALRVSRIVTVPVMENQSRTVGAATHNLMGILVNPTDYNIGADKGGAVNMFDDFDIDYNAQKYLIETRCSGALVKPYSAIAIETKTAT